MLMPSFPIDLRSEKQPDLRVERRMKSDWGNRLGSMTIEEMFAVHEELRALLEERLTARKAEVERRLETLDRPTGANKSKRRGR